MSYTSRKESVRPMDIPIVCTRVYLLLSFFQENDRVYLEEILSQRKYLSSYDDYLVLLDDDCLVKNDIRDLLGSVLYACFSWDAEYKNGLPVCNSDDRWADFCHNIKRGNYKLATDK